MYLCVKEFIFVNFLFVKNVKGKKKTFVWQPNLVVCFHTALKLKVSIIVM